MWQPVNAVRDSSKLNDPTAKSIMMVIGSYCNSKGNMSNIRNPPKLKTIASGAGCHIQTVKNWLPKLVESGELSYTKTGAGRGTEMFFTINLPMPDYGIYDEINGTSISTSESIGTSRHTDSKVISTPEHTNELCQLKETVQDLALLVQDLALLVQGTVQNGTTDSRVGGGNNSNYIKNSKSEEEEHARATPSHFQNLQSSYEIIPDDIQDIYDAVIKVSRDGHNNPEKVSDCVHAVLKINGTAKDILEFFGKGTNTFWRVASHGAKDGSLPYVKNIATEFKNALNWRENGGISSASNGFYSQVPASGASQYDPLMPKPNEGGLY